MIRILASMMLFVSYVAQDPAPKDAAGEAHAKIVERVKKGMSHAEESLDRKDALDRTVAQQKKVIEDIDKLLDPPQDGEGSSGNAPKSPTSNREPTGDRTTPLQPQSGDRSQPKSLSTDKAATGKPSPTIADRHPGWWGDDPRWSKRPEMDQYAGQRPVQKYEPIIDEYFRRVTGKK